MARLARVVAAGIPHLVTQRGNRGQKVFFLEEDYALYKSLLREGCRAAETEIWAYCLMPAEVRLILAPTDERGLRAALGDAHRRYTRQINDRQGWRGFLWAGRFASCPVDEAWLTAAARYVELAPVARRIVRRPRDWKWSSARAHLMRKDDGLVRIKPLLALAPDWAGLLREGLDEETLETIRKAESTGRPLGPAAFVKRLERRLGRTLARQKPGPKPKSAA